MKIETLQEIAKIQGSNGNWNYDPYMHGMANGLILALAILTDKEPEFLNAPERWIRDDPDRENLPKLHRGEIING